MRQKTAAQLSELLAMGGWWISNNNTIPQYYIGGANERNSTESAMGERNCLSCGNSSTVVMVPTPTYLRNEMTRNSSC